MFLHEPPAPADRISRSLLCGSRSVWASLPGLSPSCSGQTQRSSPRGQDLRGKSLIGSLCWRPLPRWRRWEALLHRGRRHALTIVARVGSTALYAAVTPESADRDALVVCLYVPFGARNWGCSKSWDGYERGCRQAQTATGEDCGAVDRSHDESLRESRSFRCPAVGVRDEKRVQNRLPTSLTVTRRYRRRVVCWESNPSARLLADRAHGNAGHPRRTWTASCTGECSTIFWKPTNGSVRALALTRKSALRQWPRCGRRHSSPGVTRRPDQDAKPQRRGQISRRLKAELQELID